MNIFYDQSRDLLIYPPSAGLPVHLLPDGRKIGDHFAVPRTLRNSQVLRHYNFPVMPVITDENYEWPRPPGITPYESQKVTANFCVLNRRCFVLSDMGVGKTNSLLWGADWLMRQHAPGTFRVLVVCPLSIMQSVWANAVFKCFLGERKVEILHGDPNKRIEALKRDADVYICNFDGVGIGAHTRGRFELDGFSKALAERDDIKLVIVDEASAYRDAQTKRHRLARLVIGRRPYLWLATGTPTPNAPTDAYGMAKLVNNAFSKSFRSFQEESMVKVTQFKWVPRSDGYEKARALLTPAIRFSIDQVWDAPELTYQQREVVLTTEQKKLMGDLKRDLQVVVKQGQPISAANEAAARQKFMQISLGAIYDRDHKWHVIDAEPRINELMSVLEEAPGKVLIFVPLTSVLELLYRKLKQKFSCRTVNGDVPQKERARIFQAFQEEDDPRVLIADPHCMAHGLDLWRAQTVVWYAPSEKTELFLQANKRAHRPGQKHSVAVVQLVSNPLEKEIFKRLENNTSLQGVLLDLVSRGEL